MHWIMLLAPPQGGTQGARGGPMSMLVSFLPIILIFLIFYLLVLRPHSNKQKELAKAIDALKQGDRVLTSGGIYGTVVGNKEGGAVWVLKIADNVKIEVAKTAIAGVVKHGKDG
jgi:preprotein translocase subunit YajC